MSEECKKYLDILLRLQQVRIEQLIILYPVKEYNIELKLINKSLEELKEL